MKFITLFNKLGKRQIKYTNNSDVIAVLNVEDLKELIKGKANWESVSVPLDLKGNNDRIWFVMNKPRQKKGRNNDVQGDSKV